MNTKYMTHVAAFAAKFTVEDNRLGNDAIRYTGSVADAEAFLTAQTERPGDGNQSSYEAVLLEILTANFNSKVNDLPAEENSDALLKRLNGWHKRPEKATTGAENAANKGQVKETNSLAADLAEATAKHGVDSPEYEAANAALVAYALSQIGK
tara:strand:+ start:740 stop:1198 length:459 start_codon:yes stop_codon:yes gene_type:complete